ncbi:unnamed protein product [Arabis nemorensis]|uniref:Uncharacterized protein n=1 Tax=Arabis nemorensis TaxID=586526 RepID=A0A565AT81_9BRAS|nr:unnamed protein product [Arabis nemorensis]
MRATNQDLDLSIHHKTYTRRRILAPNATKSRGKEEEQQKGTYKPKQKRHGARDKLRTPAEATNPKEAALSFV